MDLLIILTYVAFAWAMFKIFKIPVNKWTIPTAALGGIFIVSGLILLMNYNHPYTFKAQKAVISIPVVPQVTGVVIEVTDKKNTLIKKGEVLFRLDPTRYQARVPGPQGLSGQRVEFFRDAIFLPATNDFHRPAIRG